MAITPSISNSITEALLGSILFGLLGLIIWYPARYIPFRREAPIYSISAHVAAGLIVILAWLFLTVGILRLIFISEDSTAFLSHLLFDNDNPSYCRVSDGLPDR